MSRSLFILLVAVLLSACSREVDKARQMLENSLPYSRELEFSNVQEFPGGAVCGEYSAFIDARRTRVDRQPFIYARGTLNKRPNREDQEIFCSETPATALLNITGVGLYDADNAELARITSDMSLLADALESYYRDQFVYPGAEQGLEALVSSPEDAGVLPRYPDGGYLKSVPADPWGRPYIYQENQWGRSKGSFTITTLGADGVAGGSGKNADVSSTLLPYLEHIQAVLD